MSDIRVIVDNNLKSNAEMILEGLDLTMSQAVRMFLKQIVKTGELPFNPYQKTFNKETESAMKRAKSKKNITTYKNVDEMFKSWDKE
jgi:DNA-damage-inducible protein J